MKTRPTGDEGMRARLALAMVLMVGASLGVLVFFEVPPANRDILFAVIGGLLVRLSDVYGYSFGTSADRDRQAATLQSVAQVAQAATAAQGETETLTLRPGQPATVTPTQDGTVIEKEPQE